MKSKIPFPGQWPIVNERVWEIIFLHIWVGKRVQGVELLSLFLDDATKMKLRFHAKSMPNVSKTLCAKYMRAKG